MISDNIRGTAAVAALASLAMLASAGVASAAVIGTPTIADGAIEVVRVSGDSREVRWRGVYEAKGREWVVREAPKESHTADNGVSRLITDSIIFSAIL